MSLLNLDLVRETEAILNPSEGTISTQVVFIRSKATGVLAWQGSTSTHPHKGGSMDGLCHFLGIYRGYLPTNEELTNLLAAAHQVKEEKRQDFLLSNFKLLYGYAQSNDGSGVKLPILPGVSLSFFYTWKDYFAIQNLMEKLGVYALTYRIPLRNNLPVLIASTNEQEPRPLFGGNAGGSSGTPCVKGMEDYYDFELAEAEGNVDVWRSTEARLYLGPIPKECLEKEEYQHQVAAIKAQEPAAKKANARNREAAGQERIPFYQQDMGGNRSTIGQVSKLVDTRTMGMTPEGSTLDPVKASLG